MFSLPKGVVFKKRIVMDDYIYEFYHRDLGHIGRIRVTEVQPKQTRINYERLDSDPRDPLKKRARSAIQKNQPWFYDRSRQEV